MADLGWSDLGSYGSPYCETPNLDRFAREGLRFTDGYCPAPICSASRAAVLTGQSPARLHFEYVSKAKGTPPPPGEKLIPPTHVQDLPLSAITFAEALKPAGLATGCVGKWHLTQQNDRYLGYGSTHGPAQQGFDYAAEDRGAHPYTYKDRTFGEFKPGEYPRDATTENAIRFLEMNQERPFVLYFSNYFPHGPVHTRCRWLYDKYQDKATAGMSERRVMYGAFVETMDHYLGQFFRAMDDLGLTERTFVVFRPITGEIPSPPPTFPCAAASGRSTKAGCGCLSWFAGPVLWNLGPRPGCRSWEPTCSPLSASWPAFGPIPASRWMASAWCPF